MFSLIYIYYIHLSTKLVPGVVVYSIVTKINKYKRMRKKGGGIKKATQQTISINLPHSDNQTGRQSDNQTDNQSGSQSTRQVGRQADRKPDRQSGR